MECSSGLTRVSKFSALAISEFCSRAGNLFTFVGKRKARPGAVWDGSRERVWFSVECSSGLIRVSKFSALAVSEFCSRAGQRERVWFFVESSPGLIRG